MAVNNTPEVLRAGGRGVLGAGRLLIGIPREISRGAHLGLGTAPAAAIPDVAGASWISSVLTWIRNFSLVGNSEVAASGIIPQFWRCVGNMNFAGFGQAATTGTLATVATPAVAATGTTAAIPAVAGVAGEAAGAGVLTASGYGILGLTVLGGVAAIGMAVSNAVNDYSDFNDSAHKVGMNPVQGAGFFGLKLATDVGMGAAGVQILAGSARGGVYTMIATGLAMVGLKVFEWFNSGNNPGNNSGFSLPAPLNYVYNGFRTNSQYNGAYAPPSA